MSKLQIHVYRWLLLSVILVLWQLLVQLGWMPSYLLGAPMTIGVRIYEWFATGIIYKNLAITLIETLLSFFVGASAGMMVGLWLALSPSVSAVLDPFIKGANAMPRLILAPIFSVWFGLGIWSKVALGVTLVFFVVFFNVYQGVREVSPVIVANVRLLGANSLQLVQRVYVPSALTWVFSSLHLSVGMAFVGAVIGEYLGSAAGVGNLILQAEGTFDVDGVLAGTVILTAFALILDYAVSVIERRLLVWLPPRA